MCDVAIATTAEMKRAVSELFNYDDAVSRIYDTLGGHLSVCEVDWAHGKISPSLVEGHTPDVCWAAAGWERRYAEEPSQGRVDEICATAGLFSSAYRVFIQGGKRKYLVYWHRVMQ